MNARTETTAALGARTPNAVLTGDPLGDGIPDRIRFVSDTGTKIKILIGNRYEHFEPTSRATVVDGLELLVFAWTGSTRVAE